MRPAVSYLICCCERTGSTLLGDALLSTGVAGRPHGYFSRVALHNPRVRRILRQMNEDDDPSADDPLTICTREASVPIMMDSKECGCD